MRKVISLILIYATNSPLTQLVECIFYMNEVVGSGPAGATKKYIAKRMLVSHQSHKLCLHWFDSSFRYLANYLTA